MGHRKRKWLRRWATTESRDLFSPREKLALELCERMTYTDGRVTDRFFDELKRHFSEEELVELAAIIALENFRSKFNPVFAVEVTELLPAARGQGRRRGSGASSA